MKKTNMPAINGPTNPSAAHARNMRIQRFGAVIGLKPARERYYRELHANAWPTVIARLRKSHIRNFSIFITSIAGRTYLFNYFEHVGAGLAADLRAIATDPETRRWWKETDPCQIPLPTRKPGANWSTMEQVFYMK